MMIRRQHGDAQNGQCIIAPPASEAILVFEQTPHSMFWNYDTIGHISMGLATLFAIPSLGKLGFERWVRMSFVAHVLVTPLITVVCFYPTCSHQLLFLSFPWAITALAFVLLLAIMLRRKQVEGAETELNLLSTWKN